MAARWPRAEALAAAMKNMARTHAEVESKPNAASILLARCHRQPIGGHQRLIGWAQMVMLLGLRMWS
jgi:hypothetical protein